jgi:hypothetical protein
MTAGRAAVEWAANTFDCGPQPGDAIRERVIGEHGDLGSLDMEVAVHVADEMRDSRRFGHVARANHQHVLVGGRHDVCTFGVVVQDLAGVENRPGGKLERQPRSVGRFDDPANAAAIVRAHRHRDDWNAFRRVSVVPQHADRDGRAGRSHDCASVSNG